MLEALNQMASDFSEHPDLPETLYWLAVRYKDIGRIEDANSVYQQIVGSYPDSQYASKVAALLRPSGYAGQAEIKDANLNPDLEKKAVEVYRVARGYEEANDFNSAAKAYEQVVKDEPATIKGSNAVLDIRRLEILKAIDSNEANLADILLSKFVEDFNQNPYAGDCLDLLVDKCYWMATELKKQNKQQQAIDRYARTENILQLMIDKKESGNSTIGNTDNFAALYYYAAVCRQQQGKWDKAIVYFQRVVDNYPDYENVCACQAAIGWSYEALIGRENWPKEAVEPLIEEAYKAVLDKYPDCYMAHYAAYRLAEMSVEKGNKSDAITYYKKFLELAKQGDGRIEKVKAALISLEESK
jgi:TolA-binding protein